METFNSNFTGKEIENTLNQIKSITITDELYGKIFDLKSTDSNKLEIDNYDSYDNLENQEIIDLINIIIEQEPKILNIPNLHAKVSINHQIFKT